MKKILSLMVAALSLLTLSSCMKENFNNGADEATMTLNISMPDEVATKAYGDGMFDAKNVIIGVFDEDGNEKFRKVYVWEKDVFQQEVTIQFVMGKTYQMVLWAQYGNAYGDPQEMSLEKITLDYKKSNREDLDAFYAYVEPFRVTEDFSKSITLKRPFAQLNFATTVGDMDESIAAGDLGIHNMAQVTVKNLANTLNLFTGKTSYVAADKTETESGVAVIIPETEFPKVDGKYPTIKVEETVYEVISMNYVLVADADAQDGKTTVDLELKVGDLVIEVPGANMKRNWRTNVVGELLTGEGTFTVKIDPIFDGTYNENWNDGTGTETPDQPEVEYSEWKLLGSHNEWKTEEFMVLEDGLAVARGVEFPATKAEGDGEFKVSNGTDWYGMAVAATVGADKYLAASKDNAANILVAPGKYDIWFDATKAIIYVMTPGKAIKEATEFKAPQPEEPDQPETETWGIVGTFNSWGGQDLAMTAVKIGEVEYWFADNFAVAADAAFKFRYTDGNWDDANVYGAAVEGAVAVDAASELMQPGNNISVAAGTYDIYLDVKNALVYVMTDGKTPADVAAPDRTDVEIYVVKAADWTNLYTWGELATGAWPGKAFQETVTINEVEYNKWTLSVATTKIGQEFQLIFNNGNDVKTADSEKFVIAEKMYFKVVDKTVVKIEAPVVEEPEQPEPIVPAVALTLVSTEAVPAEGGEVVVKVTSNVAWTLALDGTKVTEGAEAVTDFQVTVKVAPNTTTEVVNHTLLLSDVPAEGAQAVTATAKFTQAAAQPEEPEQPEAPTIAEFLKAEVDATVWYTLTGKITNIANTEYGNFDLTDETGTVYVYGLTQTQVEKNDKSFSKLGLKVGDVVTLKGTRAVYNGTPQVDGPAYYVSHVAAPYVEVSKTRVNVAATATSAEFTVDANVTWNATCSTATIAKADNKVTVTFPANTSTTDAVEHVVTISSELDPVTVTIVQAAVPSGDKPSGYIKVTSASELTAGTYILVYEASESEGYVFNGKDAKTNYSKVAINNSVIDAAASVETIDITAEGDGYSLHMTAGYLSGKSGSNSIVFGASPVANTISFDEEGRAVISSNSTYLVFNSEKTNGDRFRYYKSTTVTGSYADNYPKGYLYKLSLN